MRRSTRDIEHEIVNQILLSEVCFDICDSIPTIPGRGSDFLPFYHNLNFSKGIISLHSLLLSKSQKELSLKNYLKQYKKDFPSENIENIKAKIDSLSKSFKNILPISLRHKVCAHVDKEFKHSDFTSAYIIPDSIKQYSLVTRELKKAFFNFSNYVQDDYPHGQILEQSKLIIYKVINNS